MSMTNMSSNSDHDERVRVECIVNTTAVDSLDTVSQIIKFLRSNQSSIVVSEINNSSECILK